jgi:hypothetical protein
MQPRHLVPMALAGAIKGRGGAVTWKAGRRQAFAVLLAALILGILAGAMAAKRFHLHLVW